MKKMIKNITKKIKEWDKIAIFHHTNIDGDSFSSSYGLLLAIKKAYPNKEVVWVANQEYIDERFSFLPYDKSVCVSSIDETYLAIIGDTSSIKKVEYYDELIKAGYIICFDHHRNNIDIKHDMFWWQPDFPASTMQAMMIADKILKKKYDKKTAEALMVGLLTDTGNFKYSLANPEPVKMYSRLLEHIDNDQIDVFWKNMHKRTKEDIKLQEFFYSHLKYDKNVAYVYFTLKDLKKFKDANFKNKIHSIGNIEDHSIWAIFSEYDKDGVKHLKLNLRSNGPDVSSIAIAYGGGGHIRASGAMVKLTDKTVEEVLEKLNNL